MNLEYEKARFAEELRTMGQRQEQDAEAFLEALVEAATPQLLESGQAVIVVGNDEVASVARLLLAAHGHANIEVQVAAKPAPAYKPEVWTAEMAAAKEAAGRQLYRHHRGPAHTPPTTKARKAARKRAKAGRKASR